MIVNILLQNNAKIEFRTNVSWFVFEVVNDACTMLLKCKKNISNQSA